MSNESLTSKLGRNYQVKNGFTLIELLVVIALIGLLSSIIFASLSPARGRARDARRLADFLQFRNALELYSTTYGVYPCGDADRSEGTYDSSLSFPFLDGERPSLPLLNCIGEPKFGIFGGGFYPDDHPKDPLNNGGYLYAYDVSEDRQQYVLYTKFENNISLMLNDGGLCNNLYEIGPGAGELTLELDFLFGVSC